MENFELLQPFLTAVSDYFNPHRSLHVWQCFGFECPVLNHSILCCVSILHIRVPLTGWRDNPDTNCQEPPPPLAQSKKNVALLNLSNNTMI